MVDCIIGTWSRSKGNINVTMPKARSGKRGKASTYKAKYLGDVDGPVAPAMVTSDLQVEFPNFKPKLVPTSSRGGKIVRTKGC